MDTLLWQNDGDTFVFFEQFPEYYYTILVIGSQLSSILSLLGSSLILYLILLEGQWRTSIIERFLCGLSAADFIASWGMLLQPHLMPVWTGLRFSRGSLTTCRVAGAANLALITSFLYSCCLATHFLRTLGNPLQQHRWGVGERSLHGALWIVPLLYIVTTVALGFLQPSPFFGACVVLNTTKENVTNLEDGVVYAIISVVFPVGLVYAYGLTCGVLLYCKTRRLVRMEATATISVGDNNEENDAMENDDPSGMEDAMMSYDGFLSSSSSEPATPSNQGPSTTTSPATANNALSSASSTLSASSRMDQDAQQQQIQRRRRHPAAERMITRQNRFVTHQALLYCLAFLNSVVPSSVAELVRLTLWSSPQQQQASSSNRAIRSVTVILVACFYLLVPLQGWINCIIYLRPRLCYWKQAYPERPWRWIAWQILIEREPLPRQAHARITSALSASSIHSISSEEDMKDDSAGEMTESS